MPGVHLVLTAAELGELNQPAPLLIPHPTLTHPRTQRPLAADEVRYVGEVVAFVVADDRYIAEDALALIEVEYEPLPRRDRPGDRARVRARPRVHADVPDNRAARFRAERRRRRAARSRGAPRVLRERLTIERSCGSPIEARGVAAEWDARRAGVLRVWDSTQAPLPIKNGLARLFGLPEFSVEVVAPDVGGGFGTKIMLFYPEEILVPHAAITLGRPGQVDGGPARAPDRGQPGARPDPRRRGRRSTTPGGSWPCAIASSTTQARTRRTASSSRSSPSTQLPGPYRLPNYAVEFEVAYTNKARRHPLSRRRPPARRVRHGACDRPDRARARARAGRGAAPQLHPARRVPVGRGAHLPGRRTHALRQRRTIRPGSRWRSR